MKTTPPTPAYSDSKPLGREHLLLMALQQIEGLGPVNMGRLLDSIEGPLDLLEGRIDEASLGTLSKPARRALTSFLRAPSQSAQWEFACRSAEWLQANGGRVIGKGDTEYPAQLKKIHDCPPLLYLIGRKNAFIADSITIVGTRKPSKYGNTATHYFARQLVEIGLTVVSGMAQGIDTAAHHAALEAWMPSKARDFSSTIAVLAAGLDTITPSRNRNLAQRIAQSGALVTEMPLGTTTMPMLFPRRNRIVAGLSRGTLVVEAALRSGSLITANYAAEQNREVFAVPGPIHSAVSRGCHQLIKDGATLAESIDDIVHALGGFKSREIKSAAGQLSCEENPLEPRLATIFRAIEATPLPYEVILSKLDCSVEDLNLGLIDLELLGLISAENGCYSVAIKSSGI